ncbi:MAG: InlB B-repeat-containing protein [Firmicutes bacterium]|nr:InlB B-repeat-containing protein [Bacillota bacterium]
MNKKVKVCLALFLALAVIAQYSFSPSAMFAYGLNNTDNTVQTEEAGNDGQPADDQKTAEPTEATEATEAGDDAKAEEPAEADKDAADDSQKEPEEQDVDYPAKDFSETVDGVKVNISAPEGALPEGATVKVEPVKAAEIQDAVDELIDDGKIVKAVDITFYNKEGKEIEPKEKVSVAFASKEFKNLNDAQIVHINGEGEAEKVKGSSVDGNKATFKSDDFSIYVVVDGQDPDARLNVNFYKANGDLIAATSITKNELSQLNTNIYDPGTGGIEAGEVFKGWTEKQNYTVEDAEDGMTIDAVREKVTSTLNAGGFDDGKELNLYAMIFESYHISYIDENEVVIYTDEVLYKKGDTNVPYTVQFAYTPYYVTGGDDEDDNAASFDGWKRVDKDTTPPTIYQNGAKINMANLGLTESNNTLQLLAQVAYGHWLVLHENGSGASYLPPLFVETDETPNEAGLQQQTPTRNGFVFGGWYKEPECENAFDGESKITKTAHAYAKWTPKAQANFNVLIWTESLSGGYDFVKSIEIQNAPTTGRIMTDYLTAEKGESTIKVNNQNVFIPMTSDATKVCEGFIYEKNDFNNDGKIAPDGTSVLNVYFERQTYNLKFYYARSQTTGGTPIYERHNIGNATDGTITGVTGTQGNYYYTTETGDTRVYWRNNRFRTSNGNNGRTYSGTVWERVQTGTSGGTEHYQASHNHDAPAAHGNNGTSTGGSWVPDNSQMTTAPGCTFGTAGTETRGDYTYYYRTLTAEYGENISDEWPTYAQFSNFGDYRLGSWAVMHTSLTYIEDEQGTVKGKITVMDEKILGDLASPNGNYLYANYDTASSQHEWTYNIYFKDDDGTHTHGGSKYTLHETVYARSHDDGRYWETQQHPPAYPGMIDVSREKVNNRLVINYYYEPLKYPILFMDGVYENGNHAVLDNKHTETLDSREGANAIAYGSDVNSFDSYDPTDKISDGADYVFLGWYTDDQCTEGNKYDFTTMPLGGITVYAKWQLKEYKVMLHPNENGDKSFLYKDEHGAGYYGSKNGEKTNDTFYVDNGENIADVGGTRNVYDLIGWFANERLSKVWDFSAFPLNDTIVEKYGSLYKRDGTDSRYDPEYPGTVGEINLYASWRRILEGANGINVVYTAIGKDDKDNPVEGTGAPKDDNQYSDQAQAIAKPACSAPEGSNLSFQYWVVQKWNKDEGAYEDTDQKVYPSDRFRVNYEDAKPEAAPTQEHPDAMKYTVQLRAHYGAPEDATPTHITWYNNYVDSSAGIVENYPNLAINQEVTIPGAPEREGYEFLGWAKKPETRGGSTVYTYPNLTEEDLFLTYKSNTQTYSSGTKSAEKVFADETKPYEGMYAVWKAKDVNYTVEYYYMNDDGTYPTTPTLKDTSRKAKTGSTVSVTNADKTPNDPTKYVLDESKNADWTAKVAGNGSTVLKVYFSLNNAQITVHHYLKGTTTKVKDDVTAEQLVGSKYTVVDFASTYQGKTLTVDTKAEDYTDVTVAAGGTVITIYYTMPLTISVADKTATYTGSLQYGYGASIDETDDQGNKVVTVTGLLQDDTVSALNYSRAEGTNQGTYTGSFTADPTISHGQEAVSYYTITKVAGKLIINKATLTITAKPQTYKYNGSAQGPAGIHTGSLDTYVTVDGLKGSDALTSITLTGSETDVNVYTNAIVPSNAAVGQSTGNYNITYNPGTLTIIQNDVAITVVPGSGSKVYDGTALTKTAHDDFTVTGVPTGLTWTAAADGTVTNVTPGAGEKAVNAVTEFKIFDTEGNDVTNWFSNITKSATGTLTITARPITLKANDATNEYTGSTITYATAGDAQEPYYKVTNQGKDTGLANGQSITAIALTGEGVEANTYPITITEGSVAIGSNTANYAITLQPGTLTITQNTSEIVVVPGSGSKVYDGTALTKTAHGDFTVTGVPDGFTWTAAADGTVTNVTPGAGEKAVNAVTEFKIFNASGEDVTAQFSNITKSATGTLTITARPITIQANDASNYYTGSTVTYATAGDAQKPYYKVTNQGKDTGLADGQSITAIELTGEGIAADTYPIKITEGSVAIGDNTENYAITLLPGTLTINPKGVTITANSASKKYDGSPLIESGFKATALESGDPHTFEVTMTDESTITNAGTQPNVIAEVDGVKVTAGTAVKVGNYLITAVNGTLAVSKRNITITSASAEKVYDGTALTRNNPTTDITMSGDSFLEGDEPTIVITGKQTDVGSSDNEFTVIFKDSSVAMAMSGVVKSFAIADNYKVNKVYGKLTVTAPTPTPPAGGGGNPPGGGGGNPPGGGGGNPAVAAAPAAPAAPATIVDNPAPTTIIDEPAPKAITAYWALINLICAILTALLSIIMLIRFFTRRKEEDEETGEEEKVQRKGALRIASIIPAIGAIIAFILTEDMSLPMQMVDKWTVLMIIILAIQVLVAIFANFRREDDDDEEEADATA